MPNLAAIYARVSSEKQKKDETIDSQREALVQYAKEHDFVIPNGWIFIDEAQSGEKLYRPGLESLRELVYGGDVNTILIYSPDRLSRNYMHQLTIVVEFERSGSEVIFLDTPKPTTPGEQMALHFKGIFAEYERTQTVERTRRGRLHKARQGSVSVIPRQPFGYEYVQKTAEQAASYRINVQQAEVVRKIFSLFVYEQLSIGEIISFLWQKGIKPTKGGNQWQRSSIRRILKNPTYTGIAYFGKSEASTGVPERIIRVKSKRRDNPQNPRKTSERNSWIPISVPSIIDESLFEMAQERFRLNQITSARNTQEPSLLQGLLVCGLCGNAYYKKVRRSGKSKLVYYCCGARLQGKGCKNISFKQELLENAVWEHIIELLKHPTLIEEEIEQRVKDSKESDGVLIKRQEVLKEIQKIDNSRNKLLDAFQEGECLTLEDLKLRMRTLDKSKKTKENVLKDLQAQEMKKEKIEALKSNVNYFLNRLDSSKGISMEEKRKVLRVLIDEIILKKDDVEIRHCIPITQSQNGLLQPHSAESAQSLGYTHTRVAG